MTSFQKVMPVLRVADLEKLSSGIRGCWGLGCAGGRWRWRGSRNGSDCENLEKSHPFGWLGNLSDS
jgi:hypothetical protein